LAVDNHPDYTPETCYLGNPVPLEGDQSFIVTVIHRPPLGEIEGRVMDVSGRSISGAFVDLDQSLYHNRNWDGDAIIARAATRSGPDDMYRIRRRLVPAVYAVLAKARDHYNYIGRLAEGPGLIRVESSPDVQRFRFDIVMTPYIYTNVVGWVVDDAGAPVAGAVISLRCGRISGRSIWEIEVVDGSPGLTATDSDGRYRMRIYEQRVVVVHVFHPDYEMRHALWENLNPDGVNDLEVHVPDLVTRRKTAGRWLTIRLEVREPDGSFPKVLISESHPDIEPRLPKILEVGWGTVTLSADSEGVVRFLRVPGHQYTVNIIRSIEVLLDVGSRIVRPPFELSPDTPIDEIRVLPLE
jgi:hypothetical protein